MSKKKEAESIKQHRESDLKMLRQMYLNIIESSQKEGNVTGNAQEIKNVIEAGKMLARMHHALQVDKVTQKAPPGTPESIQKFDITPPKLSPELQARLESLKPHNEVE